MFDQLLAMIIGATQKVLDRAKGGCDYMLIVGGFAESTYLIQKLRQAFAGSVTHKIVSPDVPSQAVLKGKLCCTLHYCELFLTCQPMLWTDVHAVFCYTAMLPCLLAQCTHCIQEHCDCILMYSCLCACCKRIAADLLKPVCACRRSNVGVGTRCNLCQAQQARLWCRGCNIFQERTQGGTQIHRAHY